MIQQPIYNHKKRPGWINASLRNSLLVSFVDEIVRKSRNKPLGHKLSNPINHLLIEVFAVLLNQFFVTIVSARHWVVIKEKYRI